MMLCGIAVYNKISSVIFRDIMETFARIQLFKHLKT